MHQFKYDADILEQFPNTVGGIIYATGLSNSLSSDALINDYTKEQAQTLERIGNTPLSDIPALSAWRSVFSAFGVSPTKYRSAPEALLRRLTKKGNIPSINTLVDIGNLVSIRYALPVAMMDRRDLTGTLSVQFAKGHERFTELGNDAIIHPDEGEVIFADETDLIFARRWCWRQSAQSASRADTTDLLIAIEAQHKEGTLSVEHALTDLQALLATHAGGSYQAAILTAANPIFSAT